MKISLLLSVLIVLVFIPASTNSFVNDVWKQCGHDADVEPDVEDRKTTVSSTDFYCCKNGANWEWVTSNSLCKPYDVDITVTEHRASGDVTVPKKLVTDKVPAAVNCKSPVTYTATGSDDESGVAEVRIYIDKNNDGDFLDGNEQSASATSPYSERGGPYSYYLTLDAQGNDNPLGYYTGVKDSGTACSDSYCSVFDIAGSYGFVIVDTEPPSTTSSATSPPDGATYTFNTWTKDDVRYALTCDPYVGNPANTCSICTNVYTALLPPSGDCAAATYDNFIAAQVSADVTCDDGSDCQNKLCFYSVDSAANTETEINRIIKIDKKNPETTITCNDKIDPDLFAVCLHAWYNSGTAPIKVKLECSDTGSGCKQTDPIEFCTYAEKEPTHDPDTDGTCTLGKYTAVFDLAAEGVNHVIFRSTDNVGNVEDDSDRTIQIDTRLPTTAVQCNDADCSANWYGTGVTVTFACTDPDGNANVGGVQASLCDSSKDPLYCIDNKNPADTTGICTPTTDYNPLSKPAVPEGTNTIRFKSTDNAGNVETVQTKQTKVDTVDPVTDVKCKTAEDSDSDSTPDDSFGSCSQNWYATDVTMRLKCTDTTPGSGCKEVKYCADNFGVGIPNPSAKCTLPADSASPTTAKTFKLSAEGHTYARYQSVDNAGRREYEADGTTIKSKLIKIDKTPPDTTPTLSGTKGNQNWWTTQVTVTFACSDSVPTGQPGPTSGCNPNKNPLYCIDPDAQMGDCTPNTDYNSASKPVILREGGDNFIRFKSTDSAGNVEDTDYTQIKVDTIPPTTTIGLKNSQVSGIWKLTYKLESTDDTSGVKTMKLSINSVDKPLQSLLDPRKTCAQELPIVGTIPCNYIEDFACSTDPFSMNVEDVAGNPAKRDLQHSSSNDCLGKFAETCTVEGAPSGHCEIFENEDSLCTGGNCKASTCTYKTAEQTEDACKCSTGERFDLAVDNLPPPAVTVPYADVGPWNANGWKGDSTDKCVGDEIDEFLARQTARWDSCERYPDTYAKVICPREGSSTSCFACDNIIGSVNNPDKCIWKDGANILTYSGTPQVYVDSFPDNDVFRDRIVQACVGGSGAWFDYPHGEILKLSGDISSLDVDLKGTYPLSPEREMNAKCGLNCDPDTDDCSVIAGKGCDPYPVELGTVPSEKTCTVQNPAYNFGESNQIICLFYDPDHTELKRSITRNFEAIDFTARAPEKISARVGETVTLQIDIGNIGLLKDHYRIQITPSDKEGVELNDKNAFPLIIDTHQSPTVESGESTSVNVLVLPLIAVRNDLEIVVASLSCPPSVTCDVEILNVQLNPKLYSLPEFGLAGFLQIIAIAAIVYFIVSVGGFKIRKG